MARLYLALHHFRPLEKAFAYSLPRREWPLGRGDLIIPSLHREGPGEGWLKGFEWPDWRIRISRVLKNSFSCHSERSEESRSYAKAFYQETRIIEILIALAVDIKIVRE